MYTYINAVHTCRDLPIYGVFGLFTYHIDNVAYWTGLDWTVVSTVLAGHALLPSIYIYIHTSLILLYLTFYLRAYLL